MGNQGDKPMVSIIVPVMNEQDNVLVLAQEIERSMDGTPWKWECIWVDDGSTDRTAQRLMELAGASSYHRLIMHRKNYGQSAALATGFRHARGEIFATLDGDGQNDPVSLPGLLEKLIEEDAHMVNGWRERRQDSFIKRMASRIGNGFRNFITGDNIRDVGCALRVFRRECVEGVPVFKGMHRFFPTLVRLAGYTRILEMPVNHRKRHRGRTKYGIHDRLWVGMLDTLAVCWMMRRMVYPRIRETDQD